PLLPMLRQGEARVWLEQYRGAEHHPLALMIVGIRDLKQINDRIGRADGDRLIRKVGACIRRYAASSIPGASLVARLPGREFLIAVGGGVGNGAVQEYAAGLIAVLSGDFGGTGEALHISARIGIAVAAATESGTELARRASGALAKAYGRKGTRFMMAAPEISLTQQHSAALDAALRNAIENRQITILLQPQFAVADGRLVGAEALARWHHPDLGEIGADALFAAADRCDLREELSHVIQQQAIDIAARWPQPLDTLRLSVNLGAEELTDDYADRLMALLNASGFAPERLTVELTEESLVRDAKLASAVLDQLRAHKISIALDDFGTGYSSLAYLKDLPLDYLKIDKGMTPDISGTSKDRIVLRAIIAMGKALGLMIIAEGVEKKYELEMLKAEECDFFQGYLRSKALSASDFEKFALLSN
ncbi:MAG: EAL domain-containing protein, partial [Sphingorhabdus sp.]|nr:EAL domain-containing protein [Sphingorhabdus sp.]